MTPATFFRERNQITRNNFLENQPLIEKEKCDQIIQKFQSLTHGFIRKEYDDNVNIPDGPVNLIALYLQGGFIQASTILCTNYSFFSIELSKLTFEDNEINAEIRHIVTEIASDSNAEVFEFKYMYKNKSIRSFKLDRFRFSDDDPLFDDVEKHLKQKNYDMDLNSKFFENKQKAKYFYIDGKEDTSLTSKFLKELSSGSDSTKTLTR